MLPAIIADYSLNREIERVRTTFQKIAWFREHKYPLTLPPALINATTPNDEEIRGAVTTDFDEIHYATVAATLQSGWQHVGATCERSLFDLFPSLTREVTVRLTCYGVGGSYHAPATIVTNIALRTNPEDLQKTLLHETIHLGLRTLVEEESLDHWVKERLVDRISEKVNSKYGRLQKISADVSHVDEVFDAAFPDIQAIATTLRKQI
ncbi:hypothetical protein FJY94_00045 [Candidatus Kaiserbacteria bacterium]|nr:hypothetical protein [Candidatus Kaiserbacteria bacterium]